MLDINTETLLILAASLGGFLVSLPLIVSLVTILHLRAAARERHAMNKELYGLVKKIEGLTASRRELMLKHYDGLLEVLSTKLPTAVAHHTSQIIFDAESKILSRLAELEPNLKDDESSKQKFDELIKSMENLEGTIVALTSNAVRAVMIDGRKTLLKDDLNIDIDTKLAA